jgi:predicted nuclease with TOPRIM domain
MTKTENEMKEKIANLFHTNELLIAINNESNERIKSLEKENERLRIELGKAYFTPYKNYEKGKKDGIARRPEKRKHQKTISKSNY